MVSMRRLINTLVVSGMLFLAAIMANLYLLRSQQQMLEAEQQARTIAQCDGAINNRATQLIFGEILITASDDGEIDAERQRRIDEFRRLLDERLLGRLPSSCEGIMTLPEFRGQVRSQIEDAFDITRRAESRLQAT